uniref:Uncharacterized protein MANES_02G025600 n=1 Tax=Rhizophora mucronata TaxID=61149 RepID=A0A2P2KMD4_RHIMU
MIHQINENIVFADSRCFATLLLPFSSNWANETYSPESPLEGELELPSLSNPRPTGGNPTITRRRRRLYSTHTQTMCNKHWKAYPTIHSLNGTLACSFLLNTRTVTATATNAKFQMMSRITTGFEYAQSL